MHHFRYHRGELHAEKVPLSEIARAVGTPCYVYSRAAIAENFRAFAAAAGDYPHRICYAVKANGNLAVLNVLAKAGGGFDIVSGGELKRVIAAGGDPGKTIFSGVGKSADEIAFAMRSGVACFNIESESELARINAAAEKLKTRATISVRINPNVDAKTHAYISTGLRENKFGLAPEDALAVYKQAKNCARIKIAGAACHIGSQLTELAPFENAFARLLTFVGRLARAGIVLSHIDVGGGLGVRYKNESPPTPAEYWRALHKKLIAHNKNRAQPLQVIMEPGRAIVADAGVLLTRVNCIKRGAAKNFCIVDAGMNDLLRPALYRARHAVIPIKESPAVAADFYDVVGPVCESADFLARRCKLRVTEDDILAVQTAGAYASVMSSNYNARPRAPEVMCSGANFQTVREREQQEDLFAGESVLEET